MRKVFLLCTGGTIEKVYSERTGAVENLGSKVDRYLELLRLPDLKVEVRRLMNKDSLDMTDEDRHMVLAAVREVLPHCAPVVITHGTDTLVETGRYLKRALGEMAVPIVFTGAMIPLGFERSDGLQNLTESLLAVRLLPPGIYLVMHNQVFSIDRVKKDRDRAEFIAASEE